MKRLLVILPLMMRPAFAGSFAPATGPWCQVAVGPFEHELRGVQVGVIPYARKGTGLQLGVYPTATDGDLAQLGLVTQGGAAQLGLLNLPPDDEYGGCTSHTSIRPTHQVGVINDAATARFQLGGCNGATRAYGVQVGCLNYAEDLRGAQIGCLNESPQGRGCAVSVR